MNVNFDKKDELNGTISVSIDQTDFLPSYEKKLKDYGKKASIPGFRPGNAPKGMIEKMVGQSMLLEEINASASKGLFDYIEEHQLHILGQPVLTEDTKVDELTKDGSYTFKFDIGLAPQFDLNISAEDKFPFYQVNVTDAMLDDEINRMRKQMGSLQDVETVSENDLIYVKLTELNDDNEVLEGGVMAPSVPVAFNTIKDEELKAELVDKAKGHTMQVNIFALFNNDENEISHALGIQKQGVPDLSTKFSLEITEIKRTSEALLDQEFFDKVYGKDAVSSETEFRDKIKSELEGYFNGQATHLLEHGLFDQLLEKHNITLPDAFLKRWLMDRYEDKFNASNVDEAYIPEANYLKNHLLEEKIIQTYQLKVEEADIYQAARNYTLQMFGGYNMGQLNDDLFNSIIEPQLKKEEFRSRMINVAVRRKVNDFLLSTVTRDVKEVSVEEFNKIVEEHNKLHHAHQHEDGGDHDHDHDHEDHDHDHEVMEA